MNDSAGPVVRDFGPVRAIQPEAGSLQELESTEIAAAKVVYPSEAIAQRLAHASFDVYEQFGSVEVGPDAEAPEADARASPAPADEPAVSASGGKPGSGVRITQALARMR